MNIWNLKYISTSDEEDNDSSEGSSEEDDEDEVEGEDKNQNDNEKEELKKIWKEDSPGKNENVPCIAKKLKPAKKK